MRGWLAGSPILHTTVLCIALVYAHGVLSARQAVTHRVHGWPSGGCLCRDYRKCYQLILEVAHLLPDHLVEFKVVGGLCSYKVGQQAMLKVDIWQCSAHQRTPSCVRSVRSCSRWGMWRAPSSSLGSTVMPSGVKLGQSTWRTSTCHGCPSSESP